MNEKLLLVIMNIDDYNIINIKEEFNKVLEDVTQELSNNKDIWKAIITIHSRKQFKEVNDMYEVMLSERNNDDIVFGLKITNDLDILFYFTFDFTVVNGIDLRKERIFSNIYDYYEEILPIEKILIYDKNINVPDKNLNEVFNNTNYAIMNNKKKTLKKEL